MQPPILILPPPNVCRLIRIAAGLSLQDIADEIDTAIAAGDTRILIRRGETWTGTSNTIDLDVTGPGLIESFDTGNGDIPIFQIDTNGGDFFHVDSDDWRVVDIKCDGEPRTSGDTSCFDEGAGGKDFLILRVEALGVHTLVTMSGQDGWVIQDCVIRKHENHSTSGGNGIFFTPGNWGAFIGCDNQPASDGGGISNPSNMEHGIRVGGTRLVVAHNLIGTTAIAAKASWKSFGSNGNSRGLWSFFDNKIENNISSAQMMSTAPQSDNRDELIHDVIVASNLFVCTDSCSDGLRVTVSDSTYRNNIFIGPHHAIRVRNNDGLHAAGNTPDDIEFYNNTCYLDVDGSSNRGCIWFRTDGTNNDPTNVVAINNMIWQETDPSSGTLRMLRKDFAVTDTTNVIVTIGSANNPFAADPSESSAATDFKILDTGEAYDVGTDIDALPFAFDMTIARPEGSVTDAGAWEFVSITPASTATILGVTGSGVSF